MRNACTAATSDRRSVNEGDRDGAAFVSPCATPNLLITSSRNPSFIIHVCRQKPRPSIHKTHPLLSARFANHSFLAFDFVCTTKQNHVNIMRDVFLNKQQQQANQPDTKFQTLPHNIKFNKTSLISSKGSTRESLPESSSPPVKCVTPDGGGSDVNTISIHVNGFGKGLETERQADGIERKEVSDVVDRQVIASDLSDWQKVRRRPVIVDDDMERALSAPMSHNSSPEPDSKLLHKTSSPGQRILSSTSGRVSPPPVPPHLQDIPRPASEGMLLKNRSDRRDENGNESSDGSHIPQTNCLNGVSLSDKTLPPSSVSSSPSSSSPPSSASSRDDSRQASQDSCKQLNGWNKQETSSKGNLKNSQHSQSNGNSESRGLTRRVSFDPLALLLDAALEGELELVKKTACQVSVPLSLILRIYGPRRGCE